MRTVRLSAALVPLLALGACGVGAQDDAALDAAARFHRAYAAGDGAAACATLAPRTRSDLEQSAGKPCLDAVLEEDVPDAGEPLRVHVFGTQAEVKYPGETTFLARFRSGWRVMAAGCRAQPDRPYDCVISGG